MSSYTVLVICSSEKRQRQRARQKSSGLFSKKKKILCTYSALFFFAVVVERLQRKTFYLQVLFSECRIRCFFFTNFLHWRGIMEKELEREMKNKGDEVQRRFHALVRKWDMLAARKVKISSSEKTPIRTQAIEYVVNTKVANRLTGKTRGCLNALFHLGLHRGADMRTFVGTVTWLSNFLASIGFHFL